MLGRKEELNHLNELYNSDCFEYLVMYGRRRVGKTTLLQEFSKHTNDEYEDLVMATQAFPNLEEKYLWFISKSGYSDSVVRQAKEDGAVLLTIDDLFEF